MGRTGKALHGKSERKFAEELYQTYKRLMAFTARSFTTDPDDVDDILQATAERLLKQISTLKTMDEKAIATYVVYTVRSVGVDLYRGKKSRPCIVSVDSGELEEVSGGASTWSLDDYLIAKERSAQLREVWADLPEEDQLLLEGRYIWDLTDQELAAMFNCKTNSVRMKLTRARRRVYGRLREREEV